MKKIIFLKILSYNLNTLNLFISFLKNLFKKYRLKYNLFYFKKKIKTAIFLKSPHVHKKAREQFQLIKFFGSITFYILESQVVNLISFLKLNAPKAISLKFLLKNL